MKRDLPIIDVELPMDFEEKSLLDLVICAVETHDMISAIRRMSRLSDPRALNQAAVAVGAYAIEEHLPFIVLDVIDKADDPKLRFGWLLECLYLGIETDYEGENVFEKAEKEILEINDSDFAVSAMLALEQYGHHALGQEVLSDHFDPDIADLTLIPEFAYA